MQIQQNRFESNKKTVNDAIRICVNCGDIAAKIQNHGIFCKDCGSFFDMENKSLWVSILVEVFVGIMMQMPNLEIQEIPHLGNIVQFVI